MLFNATMYCLMASLTCRAFMIVRLCELCANESTALGASSFENVDCTRCPNDFFVCFAGIYILSIYSLESEVSEREEKLQWKQ